MLGGCMSLLTNLDTWHSKPFRVVRHPASRHLLGTYMTPFSLQRCAREGVTVVSIGHAPRLPYLFWAITYIHASGIGFGHTPRFSVLSRGRAHPEGAISRHSQSRTPFVAW